MRLSHRLSLLIGTLLLAVLAATLWIDVNNAREYLNRQLASHAQDAATALGLALSTALAQGDRASVIGMTNAIFDRGDYTLIRIEDRRGDTLYERGDGVRVDGVPGWFIGALPLDAPTMSAKVMEGWTPAGRVLVRSHPGYAYLQLWDNSRDGLFWIALCGLFTLGLGLAVLRGLLRPLNQVEAQAQAICRREFPTVEPLPRTPEFARIVRAMNRMTGKVKEMIGDLEDLAYKLRSQANRHPVTGLANKRHFVDALTDLLKNPQKSQRGALVLLQLHDFGHFNQTRGYPAGDALLQSFAGHLLKLTGNLSNAFVGHLSGADFALLLEDASRPECEQLCRRIADSLPDLRYFEVLDAPCIAHLGAVAFDSAREPDALLSLADQALRAAQAEGPNAVHVSSADAADRHAPGHASEQRHRIRQAVEAGGLGFHTQAVVRCADRGILHHEVLARLEIDARQGETLTAGRFVPLAAAMGLSPAIDRGILQQALHALASPAYAGPCLAVNLAPTSLDEPGFADWLMQTLDRCPECGPRLVLEMPELGLHGRLPAVRALIEQLHARGVRFGLDRYGRTDRSITLLKALKLDHIKIDGAYTQSLEQREEQQFFIQALADIAHGLDIAVYVEAVENQAVWDLLPGLSVDGAQGWFLGRPGEVGPG